eukprot:TRINITY_DN2072_c0_g1_i1.p2 TRINITY_DN2072_c0_g1~~TRINITY_DN2072_c0_g1_i1.p2  ORF type:complete len:127 (+),score=38.36 TRINITY_DN2072_c0_g1_i1:53-382(+)
MSNQPHYKSPVKEVNPAELEGKEKNAAALHEKALQEKIDKAQVASDRLVAVQERKNSETDKLKDETERELNEASERREQYLDKKTEFAREDVQHAKEVHDRVKSSETSL